MKILLLGGGTGGHLYPLLTIAKQMRATFSGDVEFLYVGPVNSLSRRILEENGIPTKNILTAKWRRYFSLNNFLDIFKFPVGFFQSLYYVFRFMPDAVFSKGGFGSIAPALVARLYFIPILIHESDAVPGRANRLLGKIADKVAISFESTRPYFREDKILLTGNPVRLDILEGDPEKARQSFKLKTDKPIILVLGGSQGSIFMNQQIALLLPRLLNNYQIIHQVGEGNLAQVDKIAAEAGIKIERSDYHAYEFLGQELIDAYAVCDLVIARAGSGTLAEIAAVQKPCILVPIHKSANNHQSDNARAAAQAGGAVILEEGNFKGDLILTQISSILDEPELKQRMGKAMAQFYHPDASQKIIQGLAYLTKVGNLSDDSTE